MSKRQPTEMHLGFEKDCVDIPMGQLHYDIAKMPTRTRASVKYRQIVSSVRAIGLVEPIVVALDRSDVRRFLVLDGRMRLEALKELGAQFALCLISTDDEGYTYNKQVNRLSVIQEHRMILRAAERGVSVEQLSAVLNISASSIRDKFRLLDGICGEATAILADKPAAAGAFRILRKMKPFRQIDAAQTMVNLGDYSVKLVAALLQNTPTEQLTESAAAKSMSGAPVEALQRLERELSVLQADTKLLEESYGPSSLQLEIIKTHIGTTLLNNAAVVRWLARNKPDHLNQLQRIADIQQLKAG